LDAKNTANYEFVKRHLLEQFQLVPQYFLEQLDSVVRQSQETYKSFASRLSLLIDYYLSSRKGTKLDELRDSLICDHMKSGVSEVWFQAVITDP